MELACTVCLESLDNGGTVVAAHALQGGGTGIGDGIGIGSMLQQPAGDAQAADGTGIVQGGVAFGLRQGDVHVCPIAYQGKQGEQSLLVQGRGGLLAFERSHAGNERVET